MDSGSYLVPSCITLLNAWVARRTRRGPRGQTLVDGPFASRQASWPTRGFARAKPSRL